MNRLIVQRLTLFIIAASFLLTLVACSNQTPTKDPDVTPEVSPSADVPVTSAADNLFTVRYEAAYSFNPITGTSTDNMALVPLMYEGLFVLNEKMVAEPVVCDSYETSDGINYTFKLKAGIAMTDGSTLSAADAKYSIGWAMQAGRYAGRFKNIANITATDSLTLSITLNTADYSLPELLDVPIIKYGSIEANYPPGSGPYYFVSTGSPRLVSHQSYRDADKVPIQSIYLRDCSDAELSIAFSSQSVDLFCDDPADATDINILSDHEIRYYNTTILQFVGFNEKNPFLANADLRRAFGLIVDRKNIVSSVYTSHALAAPLILSPNYKYYDTAWENSTADPLAKLSEIFASLNLDDANSDGYLEIPDGHGGYAPITLTFIVNADNKYKVQAAQKITDTLKTVGINVNLTKLSWDAYMTALENGNFDMYYGDVCLPANFDLSELLSPGGSLDYGHAANSDYETRIKNFLAASSEDAKREAAKKLCAYISQYAPVIPVLYRQLNVHTNKNVVSGMKPTQSNIFYGLTGWEITLG